MESCLAGAQELKLKADQLLQDTGLIDILSRFGKTSFTGSYSYGLMTWRDIDICLTMDELSAEKLFELGADIAKIPIVGSMYFRNEFVLKTEGNPDAMFWCIEFLSAEHEVWKVDVLCGRPNIVMGVRKLGEELSHLLDDGTRERILRLKSELCMKPGYRSEFKSTDIYRAVMDGGVETLAEWNTWWARHKGKRE